MNLRIRKKYLFYVLLLVSSVLGAISASLDGIISHLYIENSWVFGMAVMVAGIPVTLTIAGVLSLPWKGRSLGARVDPSFRRLRMLRRHELGYHVLAGLGNTVVTLSHFYLVSVFVDPSTVLPFFQIVILYLLVAESLSEKDAPTLAEIESSVIVTFGAIMAAMSLTGSLNVDALLVIFLVMNPAWVVLAVYQRKLKHLVVDDRPNDAVNIRTWNVLFTAGMITVAVYLYRPAFFHQALATVGDTFPRLAATMAVIFFSYILYIRALGIGKASITQAVKASTIIFSIPLSLALSGVLDFSFSASPSLLAFKLMGITLVILGVSSFALTEVKAYVFINARPGYRMAELLDEIWRIRGVASVSALAGEYDMMAKIRIRTLGKGYERIIRRLEAIPAVEEFNWQSILKEWEEI